MNSEIERGSTNHVDEFARQAEQAQTGFVAEFWDFLKNNKKWWLTPIILMLLVIGILIVLGSSPVVAPFIFPPF